MDSMTDYGNGIYAVDALYERPWFAAIHLIESDGRAAGVLHARRLARVERHSDDVPQRRPAAFAGCAVHGRAPFYFHALALRSLRVLDGGEEIAQLLVHRCQALGLSDLLVVQLVVILGQVEQVEVVERLHAGVSVGGVRCMRRCRRHSQTRGGATRG